MTSTFWLRLWWLFRLGMLLFAATFPLPTSLAYGGQSQRSVAYDRSGESTVGYDAVSELTTTERKNGTAGDRVYFGKVGGGLAAETTAGSMEEAAALQARAQELNGLRDSWMAGRGTTTAVNVRNIGTGEAQTWIATESPGAMPSQWNGLLQNGETFIQGPGHAEQTIANALGNDWVITSGGTSRNICIGTCQPLLEGQGLQLGGPVFRGMADKTPYRMFWR